jgi:thymidylate kinase
VRQEGSAISGPRVGEAGRAGPVGACAGRVIALEGLDGAGKSTLARRLAATLAGDGARAAAIVTKPAPHVVATFRRLAENPADESLLYQDVIPPDLRRAAQLVELAVHLRYRAAEFAAAPCVIFDRWVQTAAVYCGEYGAHRDWLERIEAGLPDPAPLFYVRVPVELALERLVARGDRWARIYSRARLRAKLSGLAERYEEVLRTVPHVPLDGSAPPAVVLADAVAAVGRMLPAGAAVSSPVPSPVPTCRPPRPGAPPILPVASGEWPAAADG